MTIVVAGAGLAGLAAAWELVRGGRSAQVLVLESERRGGGVAHSERLNGFIIEAGPDGWLAVEPDIPALAEEVGIADRLVRQSGRGSFVWTGAALEPLDEGQAASLLGIQARTEDLSAGFSSFAGGMGELVDALLDRIGPVVRSPAGVTGLVSSGKGWRLALTGGAVVEADAVVLALPAYAAGRLLEQAGITGARELGSVIYHPSLTVSLAYRSTQIGRRLDGTGFVSRTSGALRACTYASRKFPGRAPPEHELLRVFLSPGEGDPAAVAHAELATILQISGGPLLARSFYWPKGIPRYGEEQRERVAAVRQRLERLAPLAIAGAGYDGAGVSACVRSGWEAGRLIARRIAESRGA